MSALTRFSTSKNKDLQTASNFALWEIGSHDTQRKQQQVKQQEDSRNSSFHQIMISYQWDSQPLVLRIRDTLTAVGCKVWMDVDKMSKDTLFL